MQGAKESEIKPVQEKTSTESEKKDVEKGSEQQKDEKSLSEEEKTSQETIESEKKTVEETTDAETEKKTSKEGGGQSKAEKSLTDDEKTAQEAKESVKEKLASLKEKLISDKEGTDAKEESLLEDEKGSSQDRKESVTAKSDAPAKEETEKSKDEKIQESGEQDEEEKTRIQITIPAEMIDPDDKKEMAQKVADVAVDILEQASKEISVKEVLEAVQSAEDQDAAVATRALKALAEEEIFEEDPTKVVQEMWRAININRRMDGAETGLREMSKLVDMLMDKLGDMEDEIMEALAKTKDTLKDVDQYTDRIDNTEKEIQSLLDEKERTKEMLEAMNKNQEATNAALQEMQALLDRLSGDVVYRKDLEEAKKGIAQDLENKAAELRRMIFELEDRIPPKEDFAELMNQVQNLENVKVSRDELGRLLEPGFVDGLIDEQSRLHSDLDEFKEEFLKTEKHLADLVRRIDEEIIPGIEDSLREHAERMDGMQDKLDLLDSDDINDTFARLEEQADKLAEALQETQDMFSRLEKEAMANFRKIADLNEAIKKLNATKVDKAQLYELLETKADVDMVAEKLDRSEFVSVVKDIKEDHDRLATVVKINEEEMNDTFRKLWHQLSLKMYTEDFITATEPLRNRIKAIIFEQRSLRDLALAQLLPDAPGVTRCFSCKRTANLIGPKYGEGEFFPEEMPTKEETIKLPPIDSVPIPPPDKPRIQDADLLPVLFAKAKPHVGLTHERKKSEVDKELKAYFSTQRHRAVGGEHTKTRPQQRGLSFTTVKVPYDERCKVLLKGENERYYKGVIEQTSEPSSRSPSRESVNVTPVVLHGTPSKVPSDLTIKIPKK